MGRRREFDTPIDNSVGNSGKTCKGYAKSAGVSTSTLYKARALNGRLHWTSLVLIGVEMGVIRINEWVDENDPRLKRIARGLVSNRGRKAAQYEDRTRQPGRHLRSVA